MPGARLGNLGNNLRSQPIEGLIEAWSHQAAAPISYLNSELTTHHFRKYIRTPPEPSTKGAVERGPRASIPRLAVYYTLTCSMRITARRRLSTRP